MSIAIDSMKCRACGKCLDVCPGSLIVRGEDKKAVKLPSPLVKPETSPGTGNP